jgi:predicted O-linked N-acetylglucosamine transferase (SPINDLY family)
MATIPEALAQAKAYHRAGQLQNAEQIYSQILQVEPANAEVYYLLGALFQSIGKFHEAAANLQQAVWLRPNHAHAHNHLGVVQAQQRRLDEAVMSFQQALRLKPDFADAQKNLSGALRDLGSAMRDQGKLYEAVTCHRRALEYQPESAATYAGLGYALGAYGEVDEAIACYRRALQLEPDLVAAHSRLLMTMQYQTGVTLRALAEEHTEFERRHTAHLRRTWQPHANPLDPQRRLRLGFVSPNSCTHPVGFFLIRVLEDIDPQQAETVCYCDTPAADAMTERLRTAATIWQEVRGASHEQLVRQIREDRIDILFDLAGHTGGNRLLVFAQKPAPVQITWLGYVGTTGLTAMDFLLADRYEVPEAAEPFYQERVLRMPAGYVCYAPPDYAPPVARLPALQQGRVTFGSFSNPTKITLQVIEVWSRILRRVARARLVLKFRGVDDPPLTRRLGEMFASQGVDTARLEFLGSADHRELFEQYHRVDVALDPLPYNGGLTTCEALWMGVPVVTCPGETFASRHSLAHLSNVGLTETIARTLEEYVELAVSLASDLPRLATLRSSLRERMAASPLCDGRRFADDLMRVLREVWQEWCRGKARASRSREPSW